MAYAFNDGGYICHHVAFYDSSSTKKQKEIRAFQNSLEAGATVVTGGGIYGTVKRIDLATGKIEIEIAKGVVITVDKSYVFRGAQDSQMQNSQAK